MFIETIHSSSATITAVAPREFGKSIEAKYPGVELSLFGSTDTRNYVELNRIEVPKDMRGSGIARKMMTELIEHADTVGWNLSLTPSSDFGSSLPRLKKFYKSFGFVENKGRNKDFTTRDSMLRRINS